MTERYTSASHEGAQVIVRAKWHILKEDNHTPAKRNVVPMT